MVIFETVRKVNVHISEINTYMKLNTNPSSKQLAEIKSFLHDINYDLKLIIFILLNRTVFGGAYIMIPAASAS